MLIELGAASWGLVAVSALLGGGAGVCLRIPSSHSERVFLVINMVKEMDVSTHCPWGKPASHMLSMLFRSVFYYPQY